MAVARRDQRLLSPSPCTPSSIYSLSSTKSTAASFGPVYRASDFGFIPVGLSIDDDDSSSICDDIEKTQSQAPIPVMPTSIGSSPDLQLVLDKPAKLYSPTETITGYVAGWDSPSTHIHIVLEGRAKTCIYADKADHKGRASLLYEMAHLKPPNQGMVPTFAVTIPEKSTMGLEKLSEMAAKDGACNDDWTHHWPAKEPYECQAGHPLPPSMSMPLRTSSTSITSGKGCVEYKLIAIRSRLDPESGKLVPEASCQVPIWLTTLRLPQSRLQHLMSETNSVTKNLSIQTTQLLRERRLSLCEQLKDVFNPSAPSFYFAATISAPRLSVPGADVEVRIAVSILPPPIGKLYNFPVPDIAITSLHLRIRSYQGLRILRSSLTSPAKPAQTKSCTFTYSEMRISKSPSAARFVPQHGNFDNQTCLAVMTLPMTMIPSFKTYNLWRSYRLECDVRLAVAGKEVAACMESDLNIVAPSDCTVEGSGDGEQRQMEEDEVTSLEMARAMVGRLGV